MMWEVGFAEREITRFEPRNVMLGWGYPDVVAEGVDSPLYVRAMVVRDPETGAVFAYACAELCMISWALRQGVLRSLEGRVPGLEIDAHALMLTATHTHSGPSGFSQFVLLNAANRGFDERVFEHLVTEIAGVIQDAAARREPAELRVGSTRIPHVEPVAFNRSVGAYNSNAGVARVEAHRGERATRRDTVTVRADAARDGRALGMINWFAVHGTSFDARQRQVHSDNKGLAVQAVCDAVRRRDDIRGDFVAIFAQEASGDVSPRRKRVPSRHSRLGPRDDARAAAESNGAIQARYALDAFELARASPPLGGSLVVVTEHVDLGDVSVDADFAEGRAGQRTVPGRLGIGMVLGTIDGPGPGHAALPVITTIARAARVLGVDPALRFLDLRSGARGRLFGLFPSRPILRSLRYVNDARYLWAMNDCGFADGPWSPQVLPVQLARLGSLRIAAIPGEPTTVAGERIRAGLDHHDERPVIVNGYANAYAGYVATSEEVVAQHYEGGSTQFGVHTLGAFQTILRRLAEVRARTSRPEGPEPLELDSAQLARERCAVSRRLRAIPFVTPG